MVTIRNTAAQSLETAIPVAATPIMNSNNDSTPNVSSDYEKCREQRIKENLERMQKLGIHDLSLKLKSMKPNTNRRSNNKPYKTPNRCISPLPSPIPSRRSTRLQNTPVVSYSEVDTSKKGKDENKNVWMGENARPEVYTEEHEKLLGEAKMEWTLFVDGYGKDGKKIYDQVRGKTCHQCRQKTLGHRTHCIQCNLVQGQFCGDCLYMRYGENVLEAKQNPDWICPVCRGICNCSLCRQAKGWAPTGVMYRKISSLGYKSVAHYLIQTHRAEPDSENNDKTANSVSAKRSLPFSGEDIEAEKVIEIQSSAESGGNNNVKLESGQKEDIEAEKVIEIHSSDESGGKNVQLESGQEEDIEAEKVIEIQSSDKSGGKNVKLESGQEEDIEAEKVIEIQSSDESGVKNVKLESGQEEDIEAEKVIEIQSSNESGVKNVKLESGQEVSEHKNPEVEINSGNDIATNKGNKDKKQPELQSSDEGSSPESEYKILETGVDEGENENKNTNPELEYKLPQRGVDEGEDENKYTNLESEYPETGVDEEENKNTNQELEYKIPETEVDEGVDGNTSMLIKSEDKKAEDEVKLLITPETKPRSRKKRCAVMEPAVENSIAGRLRSRRKCI